MWTSDLGNGTYQNPIIYADYSDPDIAKFGDDYYMISSSFNCIPGLPVLHSKDLVNWEIINHIIQEIPFESYNEPRHGCGIWAPTLKVHDGKLWVFVCTPDEGLFMSNTEDPFGEWSPFFHVKKVTGWIDSCAFWDDDGQAYLLHAFANSRVGFNSVLHLCRMSSDGKEILDFGKFVIDVMGKHHVLEGPRLFKRNGYYYITAPAGGITNGYQLIFRSKNIDGPYEERTAIHEGDGKINGPRQGGFVETENGESWFIHFQDLGAYGRVVNLQPVSWIEDWPIIGIDVDNDGVGEPVETYQKPVVKNSSEIKIPQTTDEFDGEKLALQWQWHSNVDKNRNWYSLSQKESHITLYSNKVKDGILFNAGNLLLQKLPAPHFTIEAQVEYQLTNDGDTAGLLISGMEYTYLAVENKNGTVKLILKKGFEEDNIRKEKELVSLDIAGSTVFLKAEITDGVAKLKYSQDGNLFTEVGEGTRLVAGKWIGAKVGIFCVNTKDQHSKGYANFDYVRFL